MSKINYDLNLIKAFVLDVDGVLSPSTIPTDAEGNPVRMANIKDGYVLQLAAKIGYKISIITGANSEVIRKRYNTLGINDVFIGCTRKLEVLQKWMKENSLQPNEVLYMGDDIPDYEAMQYVGLSCCPADAAHDIKQIAVHITTKQGGHGCVREVVEETIRAHKMWMNEKYAFDW